MAVASRSVVQLVPCLAFSANLVSLSNLAILRARNSPKLSWKASPNFLSFPSEQTRRSPILRSLFLLWEAEIFAKAEKILAGRSKPQIHLKPAYCDKFDSSNPGKE